MDCTIDSAATKQRAIGRVHNSLDIKFGDVATEDIDLRGRHFIYGASRSINQELSVCRV